MIRVLACLASVVVILGCEAPPLSRTASDAISLGFGTIECDSSVPLVYADTTETSDIRAYCDAVGTALRIFEERGIAEPAMLAPDSSAGAYVWMQRFTRPGSPTDLPDSALSVTIYLVHRDQSLVMTGPWEDGLADVFWAPEGLRY